MTSKLVRTMLATILVIGVSGCASKFKSDVTSWHQLPAPSGETFVIVAKDEGKRASIEFAHYAEIVSMALQNIGYRPARSNQAANLVVRMDYGVSDARSEISSTGGYMGGYYGSGPYGYGYGGGYGYGYGLGVNDRDIRSYAVYSRFFELEIAASANVEANLFESRVVSEGKNSHLEEVMPLLIDSMFQDFPGHSGTTRRVILDPADPAAN
jgi:hypothetical protein